jgi:hypothetical protein
LAAALGEGWGGKEKEEEKEEVFHNLPIKSGLRLRY